MFYEVNVKVDIVLSKKLECKWKLLKLGKAICNSIVDEIRSIVLFSQRHQILRELRVPPVQVAATSRDGDLQEGGRRGAVDSVGLLL